MMKSNKTTCMAIGLSLAALSGFARAGDPAGPQKAPPADTAVAPKPVANAPTPAPGKTDGEGVLTPKLQPQSVTVVLVSGSTMVGTISEADQWTMKTSFGTASLPLSAVAGIHMAQEGSATTTVVLHNGDSITGAVQFDQLVIQTDWGRAEILGTHVASILFTPGLKWTSEPGLNGTRWKLVASDARPSSANQPPATAAAPQRAPNRFGR
jgi:sRNA-binding regulator protein Hfq